MDVSINLDWFIDDDGNRRDLTPDQTVVLVDALAGTAMTTWQREREAALGRLIEGEGSR